MIHGVTDKPRFFPRVGVIRLGVKVEGRGYPQDTDHFVLKDVPEVAKIYGDSPKSLVITFPSNDIEQVFPTRLEHWKSRAPKPGDAPGIRRDVLFCSSDGRVANRMFIGDHDPQGAAVVKGMAEDDRPDPGEMFQMPCPHEDCGYFDERKCKRVGRLTFILPEVSFGGVYQIATSSMYGFGNILDCLTWVKALSQVQFPPDGRLVGAFFDLKREPQSMKTPDGKVVVKHVLTLAVITDAERLKKYGAYVAPWLTSGAGVKQLHDGKHDMPNDLFPPAITEGPAWTGSAEKIGENMDELEVVRKMLDMPQGKFALLCARLGGDIEKIKAWSHEELKKRDIEEAIPLSAPAEKKAAAPVAEKKAADPLDGW